MNDARQHTIGRRRFLKGAVGAGTTLWLGAKLTRPARAAVASTTGIDHIVVVTMENRSFDHFLGWLPNADGLQSPARRFHTAAGELIGNYHLGTTMGCGHPDPDHSYEGGRFQLHGGKLDNFARGSNDAFAVGYYTAADRPFMSRLALNYTTCDRYFCGIMAETYPNRFFTHSGRTDRLHNSTTVSTLPTIWDQLNTPGGPTGRYYFSDVPFLALYGTKYLSMSTTYEDLLVDAAAGTLPNVAYIDPRFEDEGSGTSGDDHPHADIRTGDSFLADVFHALSSGPLWPKTALIVTYDEWGGFYDHVRPPRVTPTSPVDTDLVGGKALLGYRVPCIVASPFTKGDPRHPRVSHHLFDHTSILKFIESNFHLRPVAQARRLRPADRPGEPGRAAGAGARRRQGGEGHPPATSPTRPSCPAVSRLPKAPRRTIRGALSARPASSAVGPSRPGLQQPVPQPPLLAVRIGKERRRRREVHHRPGRGVVHRPHRQTAAARIPGRREPDPRSVDGGRQLGGGIGAEENLALGDLVEDERDLDGMAGPEHPPEHRRPPREPVEPDVGRVRQLGFGQPHRRDGEHLIGLDRGEQFPVGLPRARAGVDLEHLVGRPAGGREVGGDVRVGEEVLHLRRDPPDEQPPLLSARADEQVLPRRTPAGDHLDRARRAGHAVDHRLEPHLPRSFVAEQMAGLELADLSRHLHDVGRGDGAQRVPNRRAAR